MCIRDSYLIEREGYRACRLEIPSWDPRREDLTIIGNDLDSYTLKVLSLIHI